MKSDNSKIKLRWELQQAGVEDALDAGIKVIGYREPSVRKVLWDGRTAISQLGPRMTEEARYDYPLTADSWVLDCGGYKGDWTAEIYRRYGCTVHVLEPVTEFYERIVMRFGRNHPNIHVHNFGISSNSCEATFGIQNDSTGEFAGSETKQRVVLKSVEDVFSGLGLGEIQLLKLNTEGAEFCIMESMVDSGLIKRVGNVQIQFHPIVPDFQKRYDAIHDRMADTHYLTMYTGWQWQNWRRSEGA